ncbi:LPXTG cell wall anchor domain-containing protein [Streptococcus sp. CSL7508-lung]|uniref:LPXTG cell wall anchor domain-containing protein n=1 Tax=Streptococcus zalophi TaxID=640031 RepID=A0A934UCW6_9STRE|nr:LPXTG cell wall anchor domain-containing protein [Streptococcus zalophi]MBJ8349155.1 LPXTG cell wall anchor domain-containing protein [Streptococcus zalophi]
MIPPAQEIVKVTWSVDKDLVTQVSNYTATEKTQTVTSPIVEGYQADKTSVIFTNLDTDTTPIQQEEVITYHKVIDAITENTDDNVSQKTEKHPLSLKRYPKMTTINKEPMISSNQSTLPLTGDNDDSNRVIVGHVLVTLTMAGLIFFKRRKNN